MSQQELDRLKFEKSALSIQIEKLSIENAQLMVDLQKVVDMHNERVSDRDWET